MVTPDSFNEKSTKMDMVNENGLETPKNLDDILQKHSDLKQAADAVAVKRGRGRPRKNPGEVGRVVPSTDIPPDLFSEDSVRPFIELPFGIANVWFKTDAFRLDQIESNTLSRQGALVANLYAPGWNPKAVALAAFGLGFAAIATRKLMVFLGERASAAADKNNAT